MKLGQVELASFHGNDTRASKDENFGHERQTACPATALRIKSLDEPESKLSITYRIVSLQSPKHQATNLPFALADPIINAIHNEIRSN